MGFRVGDNAPMAFVELVDRPVPVETEAVAERLTGVRRGCTAWPSRSFASRT